MLKDFDASKLKTRKVDEAKSLPPNYEEQMDELYRHGS